MKQNHHLKIGFVIFLKGATFSDFIDYGLLNYITSGIQIHFPLFWRIFFSIRFNHHQVVICRSIPVLHEATMNSWLLVFEPHIFPTFKIFVKNYILKICLFRCINLPSTRFEISLSSLRTFCHSPQGAVNTHGLVLTGSPF